MVGIFIERKTEQEMGKGGWRKRTMYALARVKGRSKINKTVSKIRVESTLTYRWVR